MKKKLILIGVLIILRCSFSLSYADSGIIYKLQPEYLTTNFSEHASSAVVTEDEENFYITGSFRMSKDLCGMIWETEDKYSHPSLKYPKDSNFKGVILEYDYVISGHTLLMDSECSPTLTVETNDGAIYYVRLWNYVVNRPIEEWETKLKFPLNRVPGSGNGTSGKIRIDFNNLYEGWAPYELTSNGVVKNTKWKKVPVYNIKSIMWTFVHKDYGKLEERQLQDSYGFSVDFNNWKVSGNRYLMDTPKPIKQQAIRICDDYDDSYNLTPERIINEYQRLGYGSIVNFYIGASHFYDKRFENGKMKLITQYPFNMAFEEWYINYIKRLKLQNINLIHSISMENVDAPEEWWQRTWDNIPATTFWTPTPHLLSFTNQQVKEFYKKYVYHLVRLSKDQGIKPIIQLGEPWWWHIEKEGKAKPCFYDKATKDLYLKEKGKPIYIFKSTNESIKNHEDVLNWLRDKNGEFSLMLKSALKSNYPEAKFSILLFTPSVVDRDRVPEMMKTVNLPVKQWMYPNLDFFVVEDYDYLIANEMDKNKETFSVAKNQLNYPSNKIHYFAGFVQDKANFKVWENINQAINNSFNENVAETYVWSFTQIKRDGWKQPDIIFASKPSGSYKKTVSIKLSCEGADQLRYTLDGSIPSQTNGVTYKGVINIKPGRVLKVVAIRNGIAGNVVEFIY